MEAIPLNGETWLVCGGREFNDQTMFDSAMGDLLRLRGCPSVVIHGDARGADRMAGAWADRMAVAVVAVPAQWGLHGRAAGVIRNQAMLDSARVDLVVAFPGGRGTADMMGRARKAGIDVAEIRRTAP